jgi:hypothetical protein
MQTRDNGKQAEEKRDLDLENIVGNLLIAEYQVDTYPEHNIDYGF